MNYKFEILNNGLEINDATATWESASFNRVGSGIMTVGILIENSTTKYGVTLSTEGQAVDRSDEAINALMNALLKPYEV